MDDKTHRVTCLSTAFDLLVSGKTIHLSYRVSYDNIGHAAPLQGAPFALSGWI